MFCDKCGAQLGAGQRFCGACGKEMAPLGLPFPASRLSRHLHILGVLWVAYSALGLIGAAVLMVLSRTLFAPGSGVVHGPPDFPGLPIFMHSLFHFLFILLLIKSVGGVLAGFGLLNRQSWARPLALVWSFLAMLNIPFGMALGIYTLWVLMSPSADEEYRRISAGA
jgi:hypothetical protein